MFIWRKIFGGGSSSVVDGSSSTEHLQIQEAPFDDTIATNMATSMATSSMATSSMTTSAMTSSTASSTNSPAGTPDNIDVAKAKLESIATPPARPRSRPRPLQKSIHEQHPKLVRSFGKKGHKLSQFHMPCGIAVTSSGDILVTDTENNRVQVFSNDGHLKQRIGEKGCQPHQLNHPMCVTLTRDGDENVVVTDSVNASIKIFKQDGTFLRQHGENRIFDFPYGVAITSDHHFVVSDVCKHCVMVLYPSGSVRNSFGKYGDRLDEFDHPYFVAVNALNHIIVCDSGNTCIKIFEVDGKMLQKFTMYDFRLFEEHFVLLQGVTIDTDGNIIIIGNNTIYIAARNGRFWEVIVPNDGLHSPKGITYCSKGQLIVTQSGLDHRHEVSVFLYNKDDYRSLQSVRPLLLGPNMQNITVAKTKRRIVSEPSTSDQDDGEIAKSAEQVKSKRRIHSQPSTSDSEETVMLKTASVVKNKRRSAYGGRMSYIERENAKKNDE